MPDVSFQPAIDTLRLGFFIVPVLKIFIWALKRLMWSVRV